MSNSPEGQNDPAPEGQNDPARLQPTIAGALQPKTDEDISLPEIKQQTNELQRKIRGKYDHEPEEDQGDDGDESE